MADIDARVLAGKCRLAAGMRESLTPHLSIEIPQFRSRPLIVEANASSAWAKSYQVDIDDDNGHCESYFMKVTRRFLQFGNACVGRLGVTGLQRVS